MIDNDSCKNTVAKITPKTKLVEYNKTVLVVPIIFNAARNRNVANPVPKSPSIAILGSCLKST